MTTWVNIHVVIQYLNLIWILSRVRRLLTKSWTWRSCVQRYMLHFLVWLHHSTQIANPSLLQWVKISFDFIFGWEWGNPPILNNFIKLSPSEPQILFVDIQALLSLWRKHGILRVRAWGHLIHLGELALDSGFLLCTGGTHIVVVGQGETGTVGVLQSAFGQNLIFFLENWRLQVRLLFFEVHFYYNRGTAYFWFLRYLVSRGRVI